ncbi:hypothetical protein [Pseudaminobacter salicylatoxidans]|uniref:hypothetical protein n=1 Tax=Pseudaminobacter salicylatoxidans TaxID=93369 RepID=UPI0002E50E75|nr:hypothetical protein [Pseudaminobacter salicylatoxidans]
MRLNEIAPAIAIVAMTGTVASAEGFETHDLKSLEKVVLEQFTDADYHWATPSDISVSCCGNDESLMLNVTLDRQMDEMGQETRTDEAYIAELEHSCELIGCQIEEIDAGAATARLLKIPNLGGGYKGVNVILVKDGDRLTIKSAAKTMEDAWNNAQKTLKVLKKPVLGR